MLRPKGKQLGRPRVSVNLTRINNLRSEGRSWAAIAMEMGIGEGTAKRAASR